MEKPAISFRIDGAPRTKENKGAFGRGNWFTKKHEEIVNWEVDVNHQAIEVMKDAGFPGPYTGRCKIAAAMTYECWKRCDITNYWKSLNDALNGAVWLDDSQVDEAHAIRLIDRADPGIYVFIWFFDADYMEEFWTGKWNVRTNKATNKKTSTPAMKYPPKYGIFDVEDFVFKPNVGYISKPEDTKPTRFGTFDKKPTLEQQKAARKKAKGTTTKKRSKSKKKRTVDDNASQSNKRSGSSQAGRQGTTRKRRSS